MTSLIYYFLLIVGSVNKDSSICKLLAEQCVAELEEITGEGSGEPLNITGLGLGFPQPQVQESAHPYADDVTLTGKNIIKLMFLT